MLQWPVFDVDCGVTVAALNIGEDTGVVGEGCVAKDDPNRKFVRPFIIVLPFWLRVVQCLSIAIGYGAKVQYINACKYMTAVFVVMSSAATVWDPEHKDFWFGAWIFWLCLKTISCYSWDVLMDWGLLWRYPKHGDLLREKHYFSPAVYHFALVFDFFARISWSLAVSPAFCNAGCVLGLGVLEMLRRTLWILIRVELAFIEGPTHATAQGKNDIEDEEEDEGA